MCKREKEGGKADHDRRSDPQHEANHNALPLTERVAHARLFVRDLTVLAWEADGVVLTASSNTGRLMALLAGVQKAVVDGRVRSLDTRSVLPPATRDALRRNAGERKMEVLTPGLGAVQVVPVYALPDADGRPMAKEAAALPRPAILITTARPNSSLPPYP